MDVSAEFTAVNMTTPAGDDLLECPQDLKKKVMGMTQSPGSDFDFEEWASLAKTDPEAFEARREQVIAQLISGATPRMQTRLRGLQWRIDTERRRSSNPLSSCMNIFNQMWTSVYGERGLLDALHGRVCSPSEEDAGAAVLNMERRDAGSRHNASYPTSQG
jgi:hypothetical protein